MRSIALGIGTGRGGPIAAALGVAVLYVLAGKLGLRFAVLHASASPVWPPTGLALVALLLLGPRVWPAIFAGAFAVNITTAGSVATSLGIALGNTLEALAGAWLVNRFARGPAVFERARDIFAFAGLAGLVSTALSATIGVTSLALGGYARWADSGPIWLTWWLGDAAGALVVAPCLLLWIREPDPARLRQQPLEAALLAATVIGAGLVVFADLGPLDTQHAPIAFLCIPSLLWAAFRFGPREASAAIVLLSAVAVAGTVHGAGPFARGVANESLLLLQAFMATIAITILPVAALVWERRRADDERAALLAQERAARRQAEEAERRLGFLGETARSITSSLDLDTVLQRIADGAQALCRSDTSAIFLRDGDTDTLAPRYRVGPWLRAYETLRIRPGEGLGGQVMATGRPLRTGSYRDDPRAPRHLHRVADEAGVTAVMVVPILVRGGVGGLLYIGNGTARTFTDEDETVCVRLAEQAAIAIGNAELFAGAEAARAEAEAANRAKDAFLAMLSHELRNPLGAIASAAHVLRRSSAGDGASAPARAVIERQIEHLRRLVDDLLDVSRVLSGKIVLQRRPLDLSVVVEQTVQVLAESGRHARHRVALQAAPVWVTADPVRIEQVVTNLLENALKYTPAGGAIDLALRRDGGLAVLSVQDSGVGIPAPLLPRVFDLFVQGEQPLQRSAGGLGIGLTLVKRIVELHGGAVAAASDGPGRGSCFTVRLPVTAPPPAPPPAPPSSPVAGSCRVLVIEDSDDSRRMLCQLIGLLGHEAIEAADGIAGVDLALACKPDLTLVDIGLPGIDGYEVARRIRLDPAGRRLRLVALTGYGQPEDRDLALAAGYAAHLVKPLEPARLASLLADAASLHAMRPRNFT
jgi:signal transduction histidine kinase/integral membrane sensor domain MASE1/ActR/RegA family two-component response regulator